MKIQILSIVDHILCVNSEINISSQHVLSLVLITLHLRELTGQLLTN